jgi:hypothetical protein
MYEVPPCPSCYLRNIVCKTCKADKPPLPDGDWFGHWWYCSRECIPAQEEPWERCQAHREALERLQQSHPDMFHRES